MATHVPAPFNQWQDATFNSRDGWTWVGCSGGYYLQCDALRGFAHGFFTRQWHNRGPDELAGYVSPGLTVHRCQQVHGGRVLRASEAATPPWPAADGLVSDRGGQSLWVCGADCTPVLLADPRTGHVAACHAGWRSLVAGVLPAAVDDFKAQGVAASGLIAALGPAIAGAAYPVQRAVSDQLAATLQGDGRQRLLQVDGLLPEPPTAGEPERDRLDIRCVATLQLADAGVAATAIHRCPYCTFSEPELFCSWRRDQRKAVQWTGIAAQGMDRQDPDMQDMGHPAAVRPPQPE